MTVKDYLRASIFDFVICLVVAVALGFANCGAFYVSADLQYNFPALVIAAILPLVVLFYAAYNRKTMVIGGAVLVAGTVAACGIAAAVSGAQFVFQDSESNPVIFIFVTVVCATATFLLTRKRWLSRIFVLAVIIDVCWVEFMYKQGYVAALVVALIGAGVMVVYRNYRNSLKDASAEKVSFVSATAIAAVYSGIVAGIACLLFFVVVAPLHPGAMEFKPFEKYMNYETVQMTGVGDVEKTEDPNKSTSQTTEEKKETDQENEDEADPNRGNQTQMQPRQSDEIGSQAVTGEGESLLQQMFNYLAENPLNAIILIVLVVVLLVFLIFVLPVLIKKRLRARWFAKTCQLPPNQAVERFFLFCMKRFKMLKITKPDNATLAQFAVASKGPLTEFGENPQGVTFAHIIAIYSASVYGHVPLGQEEVEYCKAFYSTFYKAFKQKSGTVKYLLRFFRV